MSCNCGECPPSKAMRVVYVLIIAGVAALAIWSARSPQSAKPDKFPSARTPEKPISSHP